MIVCSCNVFSDDQVRSVVVKAARRPRMSEVYACLGCSAQCGHCAQEVFAMSRRTVAQQHVHLVHAIDGPISWHFAAD